MEWECDFTNETFYHVYSDMEKVENNVIDFDIKNLYKFLSKTDKDISKSYIEKNIKRIHSHYMDISRLNKRAFGQRFDDDFQMYNWGLTLTMDMGLDTDKLELLMITYGKISPKRVTSAEFLNVIHTHTGWKRIEDPKIKKAKMVDLQASFKIHQVSKPGFEPTIGKRQFKLILDVNEIPLDMNFQQLLRDFRVADRYANKLHMTLVDDPILTRSNLKNSSKQTPEQLELQQRRSFNKFIKQEEREFSSFAHAETMRRLEEEFEKKRFEDERRAKIIAEKRKERELVRQQELERLETMKRDVAVREQNLRQMAGEDVTSRRLTDIDNTDRAAIIVARALQQQQQQQSIPLQSDTPLEMSIAEPIPAFPSESESQLEEEYVEAESSFDHLEGEERFQAEMAARLRAYKREKELAKKRQRDEMRSLVDAKLSAIHSKQTNNTVNMGQELVGDGVMNTVTGQRVAASGKKLKPLATARTTAPESPPHRPKSPMQKLLAKKGLPATPAVVASPRQVLEPLPTKATGSIATEDEKYRGAALLVDDAKIEKNRQLRIQEEKERQQKAAAREQQLQQQLLDTLQKKQIEQEEQRRQQLEREQMKAKKVAALAEHAALLKLEEELRQEAELKAKNEREMRLKQIELKKQLEAKAKAEESKQQKAEKTHRLNQSKQKRAEEEISRRKMIEQLMALKEERAALLAAANKKDKTAKAKAALLSSKIQELQQQQHAHDQQQQQQQRTEAEDDGVEEVGGRDSDGDGEDTLQDGVDDQEGLAVPSTITDQSESEPMGINDEVILDGVRDQNAIAPMETEQEDQDQDGLVEMIDDHALSPRSSLRPHSPLADALDQQEQVFELALEVDSGKARGDDKIAQRSSPNFEIMDGEDDDKVKPSSGYRVEDATSDRPSSSSLIDGDADAEHQQDVDLDHEQDLEPSQSEVIPSDDAIDQVDDGVVSSLSAHPMARMSPSTLKELEDEQPNMILIMKSRPQSPADPVVDDSTEFPQESDLQQSPHDEMVLGPMASWSEAVESTVQVPPQTFSDDIVISPNISEDNVGVNELHAMEITDSGDQQRPDTADSIVIDTADDHMRHDQEPEEILTSPPMTPLLINVGGRPLSAWSDPESRIAPATFIVIEVEVPTVNGEVKLNIRHDDFGEHKHGLFVHGFKPGSLAEQLGLIHLDDEILAVNGVDVEGKFLEDLVAALNKTYKPDLVHMKIRRSDTAAIPSTLFAHSPRLPQDISPRSGVSAVLDAVDTMSYAVESDVMVLRTHGELMIHLRHDEDEFGQHLFIHGFKQGSRAQEQGLVLVDDEVLQVNHTPVLTFADILAALAAVPGDAEEVHMKLRRLISPADSLLPQQQQQPRTPRVITGMITCRQRELGIKIQSEGGTSIATKKLRIVGFVAEELAGSLAKEQGLVEVNDEVLEIYNTPVHTVEDVQAVLETIPTETDEIQIKIRREFPQTLEKPQSPDLVRSTSPLNRPLKQKSIGDSLRLNTPLRLAEIQRLSALEQFEVTSDVRRFSNQPGFDTQREMPHADITLQVPKTNGALMIHIRHDDGGSSHGLFIHGFKPNSNAEKQGLLHIGDELVMINGINVEGKFLEDVAQALRASNIHAHDDSMVEMTVRRRFYDGGEDNGSKSLASREKRSPGSHLPKQQRKSFNRNIDDDSEVSSVSGDEDEPTQRSRGDSLQTLDTTTMYASAAQWYERSMQQVDPQEANALYKVVDVPVPKPLSLPPLDYLAVMPHQVMDLLVPKTNGALKIHVRHEDEGDRHGLFVHGFQPGSLAEKHGGLLVGDELIAVNGVSVEGRFLEHLAEVLKTTSQAQEDNVSMTIKRYFLNDNLMATAAGGNITNAIASSRSFHSGSSRVSSHRRQMKSPAQQAEERYMEAKVLAEMGSFEVTDAIRKPSIIPSLDELQQLEASLLDLAVPTTNGELKVHIRHDDEGDDKHGLFVHGFKPGSLAEQQGLLHVGDELVAINDILVEGKFLEDVAEAMRQGGEGQQFVSMRVRRRPGLLELLSRESTAIAKQSPAKIIEGQSTDIKGRSNYPEDESQSQSQSHQKVPAVTVDAQGRGDEMPMFAFNTDEAMLSDMEDIDNSDRPTTSTLPEEHEVNPVAAAPVEPPPPQWKLITVNVPKTNGELRMHVKHNKEKGGLFVHGFKPNCRAQKLNIIQIGDELMEVDGVDMTGKHLDALISVLKIHRQNAVRMTIRRSLQ